MLIQSLCSDEGVIVCGFAEFTDPEADPPVTVSCPPVYYRNKEITVSAEYNASASNSGSCEGAVQNITLTQSFSSRDFIERTKDGVSEECEDTTLEWEGSGSYISYSSPIGMSDGKGEGGCEYGDYAYELYIETTSERVGVSEWASCTSSESQGGGRYLDFAWPCDHSCPGIEAASFGCDDDTSFPQAGYPIGFGAAEEIIQVDKTMTIISRSASGSWVEEPYGEGGPTYNWTQDGLGKTITTLSNQIELYYALKELVCPTLPYCADPPTEGVGLCRPCCTGDEPPVEQYLLSDDPPCIVPGTSIYAWDTSPCDTSRLKRGQAVHLSPYFRDLVVGATYRLTINYQTCPFPLDDEEQPILPTCSVIPGCGEDVAPADLIAYDEMEFIATAWAMVFGDRIEECDLRLLICQLEDEATAWNAVHSGDEGFVAREVHIGGGGTGGSVTVPTFHDTLTWFHSCDLTLLSLPPEP